MTRKREHKSFAFSFRWLVVWALSAPVVTYTAAYLAHVFIFEPRINTLHTATVALNHYCFQQEPIQQRQKITSPRSDTVKVAFGEATTSQGIPTVVEEYDIGAKHSMKVPGKKGKRATHAETGRPAQMRGLRYSGRRQLQERTLIRMSEGQ